MSTSTTRRSLPTNTILRGRLDLAAAEAEVAALRESLDALVNYVSSTKFTHPETGNADYVSASDIFLRAREVKEAGTLARAQVYLDATIPDCERTGCVLDAVERNAMQRDYQTGTFKPTEIRCAGCRRWITVGADLMWPAHTPTAEGDERRARALGQPTNPFQQVAA